MTPARICSRNCCSEALIRSRSKSKAPRSRPSRHGDRQGCAGRVPSAERSNVSPAISPVLCRSVASTCRRLPRTPFVAETPFNRVPRCRFPVRSRGIRRASALASVAGRRTRVRDARTDTAQRLLPRPSVPTTPAVPPVQPRRAGSAYATLPPTYLLSMHVHLRQSPQAR